MRNLFGDACYSQPRFGTLQRRLERQRHFTRGVGRSRHHTHQHESRVWMVIGNPAAVDQRDTAPNLTRTGRAAIHGGCKQIPVTQNLGARRRRSTCHHRAVGGNLPVDGHTAQLTVAASGGEVKTTLATEDFCSWQIRPQPSWVTVTPDRGEGAREITLSVDRNNGARRSERIAIGGATVELSQREAPPAPLPPRGPAPPEPAPAPTPLLPQHLRHLHRHHRRSPAPSRRHRLRRLPTPTPSPVADSAALHVSGGADGSSTTSSSQGNRNR